MVGEGGYDGVLDHGLARLVNLSHNVSGTDLAVDVVAQADGTRASYYSIACLPCCSCSDLINADLELLQGSRDHC